MSHVSIRKHLILWDILAKGAEVCFRSEGAQSSCATHQLGWAGQWSFINWDWTLEIQPQPSVLFPPFSSPFISNHYSRSSYLAGRISPTSPINVFLSLPAKSWGGEHWVWQLSTHHYGLTVPSAPHRLVQSQGVLPKQAPRGTVTYLLIWPVKLYSWLLIDKRLVLYSSMLELIIQFDLSWLEYG